MYEHRKQQPLRRSEFVGRVLVHFAVGAGAIVIALSTGICGYHFLGGLNWVDALLNASMILGGMGPVDPLRNDAAKIFAAFYALFSGLAFIGILALFLAPFAHRLMHTFHMEERETNQRNEAAPVELSSNMVRTPRYAVGGVR